MFEAFLTTTSTDGLQPLGSAAQRSFELVSGTVRARLGGAHADLFAEPVASEHGETIDWYAPIAGQAVPLPDLPEADQTALRARLGGLIADIQAEADTLAQSSAAEDQRLSEALSNAIEIPDEAMIHAVRAADGALHPVLVHWSWVQDRQKSVRGILTGMVARPKPDLAAAAPLEAGATGRRGVASPLWWWLILLGWLLLAALLGIILYLLIAPCGINQGRLVFCPPDMAAVNVVAAERQVIEDEIAALERELALKDRVCKPTLPLAPVRPAPVAPAPGQTAPGPVDETQTEQDRADVDRRITERGAARGALNFALEWATLDDIDLYVTCPSGATISYRNRTDCNGTYDLDANVVRGDAITDPVENIVFSEVVTGVYKVRAHLRGNRTPGDKTVTLHVLRQDGRSQSYSGTVGDGNSEWTLNISISR